METEFTELYPVALTVAGSDSGGGAGIQADLRTFAAFGIYGCSAITAVTAQNPGAVTAVAAMSPELVSEQLKAVFDAFQVRTMKTGMLHNAAVVNVLCDLLDTYQLPVIVDPVMVATSGARLLEDDAVAVVKERLLTHAEWITPNRHEAEMLADMKINNQQDAIKAARFCADKWNCGCIVKGGHMTAVDGVMADVVAYEGKVRLLTSPCVDNSKATHGTGCTFSAALTASLALDNVWQDALKDAKGFVYGSLLDAVNVGDDVEAMFPPMKNYGNKIKLEKVRIK